MSFLIEDPLRRLAEEALQRLSAGEADGQADNAATVERLTCQLGGQAAGAYIDQDSGRLVVN